MSKKFVVEEKYLVTRPSTKEALAVVRKALGLRDPAIRAAHPAEDLSGFTVLKNKKVEPEEPVVDDDDDDDDDVA